MGTMPATKKGSVPIPAQCIHMNTSSVTLNQIDTCQYEIPQQGNMRVPGRIYSSEELIKHVINDQAIQQVKNVAELPGIVNKSLGMPDIHWGYGFCIGGVAAFDADRGIISPGGIGYDISCGVRLMRTNLIFKEIKSNVENLIKILFTAVPSGIGSTGRLKLNKKQISDVLYKGAQWAVHAGYGSPDDLEYIEDAGYMKEADPEAVSKKAQERGLNQLGTLGSGNHFLEIQEVSDIYDTQAAEIFGLFKGQMVIMVHTGSRGLGYQVCDDYIKVMANASHKYGISLPDRQLACAPLQSDEGKAYFSAMAAATNFARANRQIIGSWITETLLRVLHMSPNDLGISLMYDVSHNIGKYENHVIDGKTKKVCVHRKGATRAFPPGSKDIPEAYCSVGQPVIVPGSMGTASYVLAGTQKALTETFGSTCHGAGRVMSRSAAKKKMRGCEVKEQLNRNDIIVYTDNYRGLAEEAPFAYKDVDKVVEICSQAGISRKVARMEPRGVIKG